MTDTRPPDHISKRPVVYTLPGMDRVTVRRGVEYRAGAEGPLTLDLYYPAGLGARTVVPAVVFVSAGSDPGVQKALGCRFQELASTVSWATLVAASGIAGISYRTLDPAADIRAVLWHLRASGATLQIDGARIGLWASSGNVPLALSVLMEDPAITCAALLYGYMLDAEGSTDVTDALKTWGFHNPAAGRSIDALPENVPLFLARAGREHFPHLQDALDRFAVGALARNRPLTLVNHSTGRHAFDLLDPGVQSSALVRQLLAFLASHLVS